VLIATGNRWHATASMFAARAGKDIYCEKPISLTIREGRQLVDLCRRHGTIYQAGTQRRSTESYQFARELVRQGKDRARCTPWKCRSGRRHRAAPAQRCRAPRLGLRPMARPGSVAPLQLRTRQRLALFLDTGEGMHTDMGTHYTDQMQWVLGTDDTMPVEFETGDMVWPDPKQWMSETAISGTFKCRYANGVRGILYQRKGFTDRYIRYIGDEGWVQVDDETDIVTAERSPSCQTRPEGGLSLVQRQLPHPRPARWHPEPAPAAVSSEVAHRARPSSRA